MTPVAGSMPTSAATARAARSLSPVSSIGASPRRFSSATASLLGFDRVGEDQHAAGGAVPADRDRGAPGGLGRVHRGSQLGGQP
jgi:hypothetical protein